MTATLLRCSTCVCFLLAIGACSSARRSEPLGAQTLAATPSIARGEKVFYEQCHQCHVRGEAALAPALNNKPLPGFLIRMQVRHGHGAMPSFPNSRISDEELSDLVSYLKALRESG